MQLRLWAMGFTWREYRGEPTVVILYLCCFCFWMFLSCLVLFFVWEREKAKTNWLQSKKVADVSKVLEARRTLSVILVDTHIVSLT
jgi:hypothetical protein